MRNNTWSRTISENEQSDFVGPFYQKSLQLITKAAGCHYYHSVTLDQKHNIDNTLIINTEFMEGTFCENFYFPLFQLLYNELQNADKQV